MNKLGIETKCSTLFLIQCTAQRENNNALIAEWIQLREQFITLANPPNLQVVSQKSEYVWLYFQEWHYENRGL